MFFFLDTELVLQSVRELTHTGVSEQHPSESAQSLLESQRFMGEGSPILQVGQSAASVLLDRAIVDMSTSAASTAAQQQHQPLLQPPVVQSDGQLANLQVQQPPVLGLVQQQTNYQSLKKQRTLQKWLRIKKYLLLNLKGKQEKILMIGYTILRIIVRIGVR